MFTNTPRVQIDYELKTVSNSQSSADEFTPTAYPRATQTTIAQSCQPVNIGQSVTEQSQLDLSINDKVLDKYTNDQKSTWVDRPEENAKFIHGIHKKYSVVVQDTYNPTWMHKG